MFKFSAVILGLAVSGATACAQDASVGTSNPDYPAECQTQLTQRMTESNAWLAGYDALEAKMIAGMPEADQAAAKAVEDGFISLKAQILDFQKRFLDFQAHRTDGDQAQADAFVKEGNALGEAVKAALAKGDQIFTRVEHTNLSGFRQIVADSKANGIVINWDNPPTLVYIQQVHGDAKNPSSGFVFFGSSRQHFLAGGPGAFVVGAGGEEPESMTAERFYALQIPVCRNSDRGQADVSATTPAILAYIESL